MHHGLRTIAFACTAVAFLAVASPVKAEVDVEVGNIIRFFDGPGSVGAGEYGVDVIDDGVKPGFPADFISFCVQTAEFLDFNPAGFRVDAISTQSVVNQNVPLAQGTAYLYTRFRAGVLQTIDGLYGSGNSTEDQADANALQRAIWNLQFGRTLEGDAEAIYLVNQANTAISNGSWSGIGKVRIANISWATTRSGFHKGDPAQDVLILIPEPASLVTWSILGMCFLGHRRLRRNGTAELA